MSLGEKITHTLNSSIGTLQTLLPLPVKVGKPSLIRSPVHQAGIMVLIGFVGDIKGRIIIDTNPPTVSKVAQAMFGTPVEGEMLHSFLGELGNMIAGNICTSVAAKGVIFDITPPTVMEGTVSLHGFNKAFKLPVTIEENPNTAIILALEGIQDI